MSFHISISKFFSCSKGKDITQDRKKGEKIVSEINNKVAVGIRSKRKMYERRKTIVSSVRGTSVYTFERKQRKKRGRRGQTEGKSFAVSYVDILGLTNPPSASQLSSNS